ncbi:hypothetical protein [Pseudomonas orientalis]|uniref:hypothetical protein n=1 Tax=Pseudomonas orientalis TaxID=76758 RepID=UPI0034DAAF77
MPPAMHHGVPCCLNPVALSRTVAPFGTKSRSFYIKSLGGPTEVTGVGQGIQLLPLVSGYRDKDTLKVEYTTEYPSDATIEPVCFKQENITSIGFFSAEIRAAFQTSESQVDSKASKFAEHLDTFFEKLIKAIRAN